MSLEAAVGYLLPRVLSSQPGGLLSRARYKEAVKKAGDLHFLFLSLGAGSISLLPSSSAEKERKEEPSIIFAIKKRKETMAKMGIGGWDFFLTAGQMNLSF